jgi:hypothetical protein
MKTTIGINTATSILLLAFSCYPGAYAQTLKTQDAPARDAVATPPENSQAASQTRSTTAEASQVASLLKARATPVRTVTFHLRTGDLVFGKLVSDDKNKVTVERLEESKIIVSTYSKREIDSRTMQIRNLPEYRYYLDLADYFSGRTWDFREDPDDFIQAIRCCEKAKQSLLQSQTASSDRIEQIDERIKRLNADRQVWERETKRRTELRELEFVAEVQNRLKELEDKVRASTDQVSQTVEQLDSAVTDMQENQRRLEGGLFGIQQQLNMLADQTEVNRRLLDPWSWNRQPRYYYRYRP